MNYAIYVTALAGLAIVAISGRELIRTPNVSVLAVVGAILTLHFGSSGVAAALGFPPQGKQAISLVLLGVGAAFATGFGVQASSEVTPVGPAPGPQAGRKQPIASGALCFLCLGAWLLIVDLIFVSELGTQLILSRFIAVGTIAAMVVLVHSRQIDLKQMAVVVYFTFGLACILTAFEPDPTRACSDFKCGVLGAQLRGPYENEHAFGMLAATALIFALRDESKRMRLLVAGSSVFVIVVAHSRGAQIGALVALLAGFLWTRQRRRVAPLVRLIVLAMPAVFAFIGIRLVYDSSRSDFSNRGIIWSAGLRALGDRWVLGRGIDAWSVEAIDRNYMHSQYLFLLFSGGVPAIVLFVLAITSIIHRVRSAEDWHVLSLVVLVLVAGLTSVVWNLIGLENGVLIGLILIAATYYRPAEIPSKSPPRPRTARRAARIR